MEYRIFKPCALLKGIIDKYWILRCSKNQLLKNEVLIPGGSSEIVFNLLNPIKRYEFNSNNSITISPGAHLVGQKDRAFIIKPEGDIFWFGARFLPGGLSHFVKFSVIDIKNNIINLTDIFGSWGYDLEQKICNSNNDEHKITLLETALLQKIQNINKDSIRTDLLKMKFRLNRTNDLDIDKIKKICFPDRVNYKHMERFFSRYIGYSPKSYLRIVRFNRALKLIKESKISLTQIGLECSYYDQSHFTNDFKKFTGISPSCFDFSVNKISGLLVQSKYD